MRFVSAANLLWLTLYLAMVGAIVWALVGARERAMIELAGPQAQADWEEWRQSAKQQAASGPVQRREPRSDQPPALVLLRDHFPVLVTGSIVLCSFLFGTLMFILRGAISSPGISGAASSSPTRTVP